jgi:hypothetical protein
VLVSGLMQCVNLALCKPPLSQREVETLAVSVVQTHLRNLRGAGVS